MGEIKPLGSEKLLGEDKLNRILDLTFYNNKPKKTLKENSNPTANVELVVESKLGGVYAIVKEKDGYYVKQGLNESSLDYIGGMFMKNKNRFRSYADSLKRLNLIKGQTELNEAKKFVLKNKKNSAPMDDEETLAPPMPTENEPMPTNEPSMEMEDAPEMDAPEMDTEGGEEEAGKRSDYMAEIQKYSGKLGQELRDQKEKLESDDIKYVLNMIISAVNLDVLEMDDLEDIAKKFERDEEEGEEFNDEEMDDEIEDDGDAELEETINMLNQFTEEDFDFGDDFDFEDDEDLELDEEIDFSEYSDLDEEDEFEDLEDMGELEEDTETLDIEKMKQDIESVLSKYIGLKK